MKTYRGYSDSLHDAQPCIVVVQDGALWQPLQQGARPDRGWGWGYGGPEAAALARAILADHLGYAPPKQVCERFLWEVVGRWAQGWRWAYTGQDINTWLARARRRGIIPAATLPARDAPTP